MSQQPPKDRVAYIGCYTQGEGGEGIGITIAHRDPSGALVDATVAIATPAPSFLVEHPELPVLYAVNEVREGQLSAFTRHPDGQLTPLGVWPTGGVWPCHLAVGDGHIYVANYGTGTIAVFPLDAKGRPSGRSDLFGHSGHGPHPERQEGPHAHLVHPYPGGLWSVDLGLDQIHGYTLNPVAGTLNRWGVAATLPAGSGPRHFAIDLAGVVHVLSELAGEVVSYDATDPTAWREVGRVASSVEPGFRQPSAIAVSPDGRFLYAANRAIDTIAVFSLVTGRPTFAGEFSCGGAWPRDITLVDDLIYVANERSHRVTVLRRDLTTGSGHPDRRRVGHAQPDLRPARLKLP